MEHMDMRWAVKRVEDCWSVRTVGRMWFVCNIVPSLPDDEEGLATAQAICDEHNRALERRGESATSATGDAEKRLTELREERRQQLWVGVATAVARAEGTKRLDTPAAFADAVLDAFDKRFTPPKEVTTGEKV